MSIRDYKITDEQFNEKGMTSLPDTLKGTPYENKRSLEKFTREVVAPNFNAIVEDFAQMEESANNWSAEEAQRVQRENGRQAAEQGRADAESTRAQSEKTRLSAESQRVVNENARSTAETARANAENGRASAESARVTAENARNAWEEYSDVKTYAPGNKVSFGGSSYVCTAATVGHEPTDTAYWLLIAQKGMDGAGADDLRQINNALDAIDPTKVTTKATPADGDGVMIADSADGGKAKRLLWSSVKTALGKLFVPLARKVNGKTLAKDVTLTGDDIAMGADDAESLRTAMAKRNADYGLIFPENLQEWALKQTVSGTFLLTPNTTDGVPDTRYWFGQLICIVKDVYNDYALNIWTDQEYYSCVTSGGKWTNPWIKLAQCVPPEVHDFPLADGFTGDIIYYKTQENICTVSGCIYGTFTKDSYISIGYLPEGFHSAHALELPVTASYGVGVRCSVATDGNVVVIISTSGVAYVYLNISFPCA